MRRRIDGQTTRHASQVLLFKVYSDNAICNHRPALPFRFEDLRPEWLPAICRALLARAALRPSCIRETLQHNCGGHGRFDRTVRLRRILRRCRRKRRWLRRRLRGRCAVLVQNPSKRASWLASLLLHSASPGTAKLHDAPPPSDQRSSTTCWVRPSRLCISANSRTFHAIDSMGRLSAGGIPYASVTCGSKLF
jgi:hypothetical protein